MVSGVDSNRVMTRMLIKLSTLVVFLYMLFDCLEIKSLELLATPLGYHVSRNGKLPLCELSFEPKCERFQHVPLMIRSNSGSHP